MNNRYAEFIQANNELWSKVASSKGSNGVLLVGPQPHPNISHMNAVFARVLKEANGLRIRWIDTGDPEVQERLLSYDSASCTIPLSRLTRTDKLVIILRFALSAFKIVLTRDILSFSLDGIPFGDILYDSYLARYGLATVSRINKAFLRTLLILIYKYYRFKRTILDCGASAVLVSDQVGLSFGVLMRTALKLGLPVYLRQAGNAKVSLNLFNSLSEIYEYAFKPRVVDMQLLSSIDQITLDKKFGDLMEGRMNFLFDHDAMRAYDKAKKVYYSKSKFADDFQLSATKKFVFVMLHAFNDYPHSHFGEMIFKDYYHWFVQTLEFAKTKSDVTWIFKEHPWAFFYPTHDVLLSEHFANCPDHIVFLDRDLSFNTKSLQYIADVILTVLGTAGIEFSSAGGIPTILAGPNHYSGFGFTIEPKNQAEYFKVLANIESINRLTKEQQDIARKVFLYIQYYSYAPSSWSPLLKYSESKDPRLDSYYWERVIDIYKSRKELLLTEFKKYVESVREREFSRLTRLDFPNLQN